MSAPKCTAEWTPGCGAALPPQLNTCKPPLDPRVPSVWNTFPGWWDDIYGRYYGMANYSKFCTDDPQYSTWQGFVEDREGDQIPFKLKDAQKLRWDTWPGTCTGVGTVKRGEVIAPPGTQSVLKLAAANAWTKHAVGPDTDVGRTPQPKSVFDLPTRTFNSRMLHNNTTQPF